jgi:hypothetical protein
MNSKCSPKLYGMRLRKTLGRLAFFLVVLSVLPRNFFPTVGAQSNKQPVLGEEEKRDAVQLSLTFTRRLGQTLDMAVVMNELFLADSIERFIAAERWKASRDKNSYLVFSPGIFVDVSLLETPAREDWRQFYIATNNFMLMGFIHGFLRGVDFADIKPADLYPREVIKLLDANPLLSNLIQKKSTIRNFKSFEEMRSATATLDQAVALMRKALPGSVDLEKAVVQMAMRQSSVQRPIKDEDLERARAELIKTQLQVADDEFSGFPKGTRVILVPTFSLHELVLVKVDGRLRVAWAYLNPGD